MTPRYWLAAAVVLGAVLGVFWPTPPLPSIRADRSAAPLPSAKEIARASAPSASQLLKQLRWDGDAGTATESQPQWQLLGIANEPQPVALIQPASAKRLLRLSAGATLPDGSKLTAIDGDRITVENGNCRRVLQLHRTQPVESSADCPGSGKDAN